jgi:IS605 OrfB family transposase
MKLTLLVKMSPTPEQHQTLLETMERFNKACNDIAEVAYQNRLANKWTLHKLVYYRIREQYGLSAQMTVRAISKVVEAYKRDKRIKPIFNPHGAMVYDERILSWKGLDRVSILSLKGRLLISISIGPYQEARLDRKVRQADLIFRKGVFYLAVVLDAPEPTPYEPKDWLGVDLGVKNIAVDSDGQGWSSGHLNGLRSRHAKLRARLQSKDTKSAKRLLKKRSGKERRFATAVNHLISKKIVEKAKDTLRGIALENLKGIRTRVSVNGSRQRRTIHSWGFNQLRAFVEYKAKLVGVPLLLVNPRNTSRTCPACGYIAKGNRNGESFSCQECGFAGAADHIAAENIRRVAVNRPHISIGEHFLLPPSGTSLPLQG